MSTVYWKADEAAVQMLDSVIQRWHPELKKAGVKIGFIFALNDKGAPVKHGGYPAYATIRVVPLKDRVSKGYDAELLVDGGHWANDKRECQYALLDHEMSHLILVRDKPKKSGSRPDHDDMDDDDDDDLVVTPEEPEDDDEEGTSSALGEVQRDDLGRPKLRTIKADWNVGDGFRSVVLRHGENSVEYTNLQTAKALLEELLEDASDVQSAKEALANDEVIPYEPKVG